VIGREIRMVQCDRPIDKPDPDLAPAGGVAHQRGQADEIQRVRHGFGPRYVAVSHGSFCRLETGAVRLHVPKLRLERFQEYAAGAEIMSLDPEGSKFHMQARRQREDRSRFLFGRSVV